MTQTVFVTGAAGGMGTEAVRALCRRGANVVCVDVDADALERTVEAVEGEGRLVAIPADVCDHEAVESAISEGEDAFGRIDGLFNIAGSEGALSRLHETTPEEFDRVFRINATSVFLTMRLLIPRFLASGGGRILNTGSYAAVRATKGTAVYGAAKHAVVGLTKSVALEYARNGIRANVIGPGAMNTRMLRSMFAKLGAGDLAAGERIIRDLMPTHDLVEPAELGAMGAWILCDAPDQFTGQVVMVDGGRTAS